MAFIHDIIPWAIVVAVIVILVLGMNEWFNGVAGSNEEKPK